MSEKRSSSADSCGNSTGIQADNQVTITTSETSTAAGNLDASSALHLYDNNYSVWNINIKNTYGPGSQVNWLRRLAKTRNLCADCKIGRQLRWPVQAITLRCMLVESMGTKTRSMQSQVINISPGVTLKVDYFSKPSNNNHLQWPGADDFIFGNAAAWFGDCK